MAPFESAMVVSYRFSNCDLCAISEHSAAICHRLSPMLKSTGVGPLRGGRGWPT